MKTTRLLAVPALAAASLLALTGCIQLPPIGGGTTTETQAPATGSGELEGTSWSGAIDGVVEPIAFTLNADGTVDITSWGGPDQTYDSPTDVWEGDASEVSITITGLEEGAFDATFTGSAADGSMELTGEGTDGGSYQLNATQD
jgi:hypothetical protein